MRQSGCDFIFFAESYRDLAEQIAADCGTDPRLYDMSALAAGRASGDTFDALPRALDGVARIAPTGGTTGEPKAVMMTHQTLVMLSELPVTGRPVVVEHCRSSARPASSSSIAAHSSP